MVARLLIENDLWKAKRRKRNVHPLRERRPRFGELVQMDGSPHDWFEERGPRCTLLLAIDDATSRITSARFENTETTDGYLLLIRKHLETFGRFRAAYTDKHSIFRRQQHQQRYQHAMQRSLDRAFGKPKAVSNALISFQDRLIMRLETIAGIGQRAVTAHNAAVTPQSGRCPPRSRRLGPQAHPVPA